MTTMTTQQDSQRNPLDFRFSTDFFNQIPETSGVYWFLDSRRNILYVGSSQKLRSDLEIFKLLDMGTVPEQLSELMHKVRQIDWSVTECVETAESMKSLLIRQCQPPYNPSKGRRKARHWFYKVSYTPSKLIMSIEEQYISDDSSQHFGPYSNKNELLKSYSSILRWVWLISHTKSPEELPVHLTKPQLPQGLTLSIDSQVIGNHKVSSSLYRFLRGNSDLFIDLGLRKLEASEKLNSKNYVLYKLFRSDSLVLEDFFRKRARKVQEICSSLASEQRIN